MNNYKEKLLSEIKETKAMASFAIKQRNPSLFNKYIKEVKELDKKLYSYNFDSVPYDLSKSESD